MITPPPQIVALASSLSYAICTVAARRGMQYSTPLTVTFISVMIHTVTTWTAVYFTGGIPEVLPIPVFLFIIAGLLQPLIRLLTYSGIDKLGASRSTPLRSTHPVFSVLIAITVLQEKAAPAVVLGALLVVSGIVLVSWQRENKVVSYRRWYLLLPLAAAVIAGIVHPIRRFALNISDHPLFFTAFVGLVSLIVLAFYFVLPGIKKRHRLNWDSRALIPFIVASVFETLGILLGITSLSLGPVVLVSPIISISPIWILLGTVIFLRDLEKINIRTILGTLAVVGGTIAISLGR